MSCRRKGVFCHERAPASLLSHREPDAEFLRRRAGTLLHPARPELPDTQPRKGAGRRTVPPHDDAGGPHRGRPRPAAPCGRPLPRHPQRPHGAERLRHPPHPDPPPAAGAFAAGPHLPHPDGEAPRRAAGL